MPVSKHGIASQKAREILWETPWIHTNTAVQASATVCKANKKKNSFYISIHLHRVELENLVSHQVISQLNRILNYGKSSAKQSKFVDLNVSPRIFSLNLDQIPAQGRLPSWAVFKFHSTGDAFGSETFRGNPKSEQVVSRIFFHDFKSTKPPASNSLMWQLIGPFFQLQRVFFMFTSLCCHGTVMTSLGGSMEIVGNGTLEVGAALADMRAS